MKKKNSLSIFRRAKSVDSQQAAKARSRLSFNMPIKILVIGGRKQYCQLVCCAVGAGLSHLSIGAVTAIFLLYSIKTGDTHAILCCAAYQCLSAEAILCLIHVNGWSAPIRHRHRKCIHVSLQICSLGLAVMGTILVTNAKGISDRIHGVTGLITSCLAAVSVLTGVSALFFKKYAKYTHILFGISTFAISSLCVGFSLFTPAFEDWAGNTFKYITLGILLYYSLFIIVSAILKYTTCY